MSGSGAGIGMEIQSGQVVTLKEQVAALIGLFGAVVGASMPSSASQLTGAAATRTAGTAVWGFAW